MLDISIIRCLSDNYSYLIRDKTTNLVGVVDPSEFYPVDLEISKNYKKLEKSMKFAKYRPSRSVVYTTRICCFCFLTIVISKEI